MCGARDSLRAIPAVVHFISAEPLRGPLPSLDLHGTEWLIVGGESGQGYRPMQVEWARDLGVRCAAAGIPFFFKQSAAPRTEMGIELDGKIQRAFPIIKGRAGGRLFT
jgi:protein gp37